MQVWVQKKSWLLSLREWSNLLFAEDEGEAAIHVFVAIFYIREVLRDFEMNKMNV